MTQALTNDLDAFRGLHVAVIGEAMLDSYLDGGSSRLCPEAPVPVVAVAARRDAAGGAANTAVNLRALGAKVEFLSVIGNDAEGMLLQRCLEQQGIAAEHVLTHCKRRTLSKQRVCACGQILVRFDQGDTGPLDSNYEKRLIERLEARFSVCDAVIVSDYGYGVLTPVVIAALSRLQAHSPRILVADSKQLRAYRRVGLTAIKPNYAEAIQVLNLTSESEPDNRAAQIIRNEKRLLDQTGARIAAVTLDRDGAILLERDRVPYRTFARPASRGCPSGAGDTFLAAFALALAAGADTPAAAEIASAAAAVVVAKEGTAVCSAAELRERLLADGAPSASRARLAAELAEHRRQGRRIVFTNGCFDILHRGHVSYLRRARELGDILVVGVNSDASIRRLKGPSRPINTLEDRLTVLAALRFVDYLVPFDEDTPHELIRLVRPDIFVKGGDYTRDRLPEASLVEEQGGIVRILPLVEDRSTTSLIDRIRGGSHAAPSTAFPVLNGQATS
ncbi:MAG TPA: D-glycero-beta-D-manno-heptose 1-phosphate adenylyltransferase [Gemmataceae bacterium]|nr:D-glycero-beta-D-manno-heptose 1-phosphate adenylyltransferase [Gemmataceae bacterium]